VTVALLDDHLLRDMLGQDLSAELSQLLDEYEPATTNLYFHRLCRSVVSARGGMLTGSWPAAQRRELGRSLLSLPDSVRIIPMRTLAYRMAEIADTNRVSTLGAEAVAAAEHLDAPLCVWAGDDGPAIRTAVTAIGGEYRVIPR
jgi:hypothetical protein